MLGTMPAVFVHYVTYFSQQIHEGDRIIILVQWMRKLKSGG